MEFQHRLEHPEQHRATLDQLAYLRPTSLYYCPSDRGATELAYDKNDNYWRLRSNYVVSLGPYSSPPSTADVGNGVFGFQVLGSSGSYAFDLAHPLQTRINQITNGTSNTVMMSESIMSSLDDAVVAGQAGGDQRGDVFNDDMLYMAWGFSSVQPPNSLVADIQPYCGGGTLLSPCTQNTTGTYISARSWHPGGVNALYADGHVDFMSNSTSLSTWQAINTRDGGGTGSTGSSGGTGLQNGNFSAVMLQNQPYTLGADTGYNDGWYFQQGTAYMYTANQYFPNPVAGSGNPYFTAGTTTSWTWGGMSSLINGPNAAANWSYNPALPSGSSQFASLQDTSNISQTIYLSAGTHTLSFWLAQRQNGYWDLGNYVPNPVTVTVTGSTGTVFTYGPVSGTGTPDEDSSLNPTQPPWTQYANIQFSVPTAGSYTIMFATSSAKMVHTGLKGTSASRGSF